MTSCLVCNQECEPYRQVDGHAFYACSGCGLIQLDPETMQRIDRGEPVIAYADGYWANEMVAARERAYGVALARMAEVFILAQRPVRRFLDVGTGPGTFLDAVSTYLPLISNRFHGIELFPPPEQERTRHPNYRIGRTRDYPENTFDGGMCMEVFEHLTPRMVDGLLSEIAAVSQDEACFLINTGLAAYTRNENPGYLDPTGCGHITSWTIPAVNHLAQQHGLVASAIPGRDWCFLLEKASTPRPSIEERQSQPIQENIDALHDPAVGASPISLLGTTALRETYYYDQFNARTRWALSLDQEIGRLRAEAGRPDTSPVEGDSRSPVASPATLKGTLSAAYASGPSEAFGRLSRFLNAARGKRSG